MVIDNNPPPAYDETEREQSLQGSFVQLTRQHDEIRVLFMKVANELDASPKVGPEHDLAKKWSELSKKHKKLYRDSQQNASACASFLKHYADVLVPLSAGQATAEEQKALITNFMEGIPGHQQSARDISTEFGELAEEVERFPALIERERVLQAAEGSWLGKMKSGVQWLCSTIWNALQTLLKSIISAFRTVLSCVKHMRFSCGPFVMHIEPSTIKATTTRSAASSKSTKALKEDIQAATHEIAEKLTGFEDAWHLTSLACADLLRYIERADLLSAMPGSFHAYIAAAEIQSVYYPMVQCMDGYARGKSCA
ncbi:hypothetical protein PsYK624_089440 [Phanerochaete sordida]|uniref:Uncharacterized protein n=1 Tax=Phanerochaete sordida TaxID=48140 RepID=A0A9P3LG74_9APHY|nr:hypothetical protein PsYK624_089440 [Phanerochaete sordida]